jgi:hypothetical protein
MKKLTYADFEIGQIVMCKHNIQDPQFYFYLDNEHLIPGEYYTITDLEFRFPDKICVSGKTSEMMRNSGAFCPIEYFDTQSVIRDTKLNEILK